MEGKDQPVDFKRVFSHTIVRSFHFFLFSFDSAIGNIDGNVF